MGLKYPLDLAAWHSWQRRQHAARHLKSRLTRQTVVSPTLHLNVPITSQPQVLVVIDVLRANNVESMLQPFQNIDRERVAVMSAEVMPDQFGEGGRRSASLTPDELDRALPDVAAVYSYGHYLAVGAVASAWAEHTGRTQFVLQHGLLTPYQPPLPPRAHALAWSAADAEFWRSGRDDVTTTVVGSTMLHAAAQAPAAAPDPGARPVYLGQLHGAELPRRGMARAAVTFCRDTGADYRPHPSEIDKVSRVQHRTWERRGIHIDRSGIPLPEVRRPVVAAFSTGILEAAARGLPSYAYYPDPPDWLREFWQRYDMHPWGASSPTPPPETGADPAAAIRAAVMTSIERSTP